MNMSKSQGVSKASLRFTFYSVYTFILILILIQWHYLVIYRFPMVERFLHFSTYLGFRQSVLDLKLI